MVQYVSSLNWAGKGTTMHLKRQLRRDTQNHSAWQPLLYTERTLFQTTVVLTQFQSRLCGSISYLHRSLEGKPLHSWPEFSCIGTRRLRSSYQQKMVRNLNGFASTWLRNGSPGPPPAAMSSSISLHYSSGWCTASIYMQFFGKELLHQIHALSASGTHLNVKLRLTITIGKVFSQTGKRSVGKTCFVILESIAKAWAANLSLVWRRVAHSIYCLLSTSCDAFDDGSGKVRQQASSSINATFHNLPISKQRDREEQPKLRPGPLHDLRSTGVRWAVQRSSLFFNHKHKCCGSIQVTFGKVNTKMAEVRSVQVKKNLTSSKSCPARLREGNTLVWLGFILAVVRKHPSHFFQSVASTISWCAIKPLYFCKILWRSPDKDGSSTSFSEVCNFWPDQHPS